MILHYSVLGILYSRIIIAAVYWTWYILSPFCTLCFFSLPIYLTNSYLSLKTLFKQYLLCENFSDCSRQSPWFVLIIPIYHVYYSVIAFIIMTHLNNYLPYWTVGRAICCSYFLHDGDEVFPVYHHWSFSLLWLNISFPDFVGPFFLLHIKEP